MSKLKEDFPPPEYGDLTLDENADGPTSNPRRRSLLEKGVLAVRRSMTRTVLALLATHMLRTIAKDLQKTPDHVSRLTMEYILESTRPGIYDRAVNVAAWDYLLIALQRLPLEQMSMVVNVAITTTRWQRSDLQTLVVIQMRRCDRANWSQFPSSMVNEPSIPVPNAALPWPCDVLRSRYHRILLEVLRADHMVLHELIGFAKFSSTLCTGTPEPSAVERPYTRNTYSSFLHRVMRASIDDKDVHPRDTPFGVLIECTAEFVLSWENPDLVVGAVSNILKFTGHTYFSEQEYPLPPNEVQPVVPYLWLACRLCRDKTSAELLLEGDIIGNLSRLWVSTHATCVPDTNPTAPSPRIHDLRTAIVQLIGALMPYRPLGDILAEFSEPLSESNLLKFNYDGICARADILCSRTAVVALTMFKTSLCTQTLGIPKAAYHLVFSVLALPTDSSPTRTDDSVLSEIKQLATEVVLLTSVLPEDLQDTFTQYCTVHGQAFGKEDIHAELKDIIVSLTKSDFASQNMKLMWEMHSLAKARVLPVVNPIDRFAQMIAPVIQEADGVRSVDEEPHGVTQRWSELVDKLNEGAFDYIVGSGVSPREEELEARKRLLHQVGGIRGKSSPGKKKVKFEVGARTA